jgi:hypothetical protein
LSASFFRKEYGEKDKEIKRRAWKDERNELKRQKRLQQGVI